MCSKEGARIVLWMAWIINMLITTVYYIICFATANYLVKGYDELNSSASGSAVFKQLGVSNNIWRAPIAACVLGGILVLLFNLLGCIILLKKTINKSGPGFGYGFLTAFCFTLSFFVLLVGVVLEGFTITVESKLAPLPSWGSLQTGTFKACLGFSFLCFCLFFLFFIVLIIFQAAVSDQLGIDGEAVSGKAKPSKFGASSKVAGSEVGMAAMAAEGGAAAAAEAGAADALDPNAINLAAVEQQQYDYGTEEAYGYGQDGAYGYGDYSDPPPQPYGYAAPAYNAAAGYGYGTAQPVQPGQPAEQQFGYPPQQPAGKPPAYGYDNDSVV